MLKDTDAISGSVIYPFKWYYRPEHVYAVPIVQIDSGVELTFEELPGILQEIDKRHWGAIRQILIEAKLKAEMQLRNDDVIKNTQLTTYYQGWVNYADYVLANMEGLRAGEIGPDTGDAVQANTNVR